MKDEIQIKHFPCYECLCLPICKGKTFGKLVDCELFFNFTTKHCNEEFPVSKFLEYVKIKGYIYESE